jgi:hypothetical protein
LLFLRGGKPLFFLEGFEDADRGQVVGILRRLAASRGEIIGNPIIGGGCLLRF